MIPIALSIAGSDPSCGAGIQADLKVFHTLKVYGLTVPTLLTAQNTKGIQSIQYIDPNFFIEQLDIITSDIQPNAIKTGALGKKEVIQKLSSWLENRNIPLIIDPVMKSKNEFNLLDSDAIEILKTDLIPKCELITPNCDEAEVLTGIRIHDFESMEKASKLILDLGAKSVLIKGGHLENTALDYFTDGTNTRIFQENRIPGKPRHGTGCTFSAAITAELAKGQKILNAIEYSKKFITQAIRSSQQIGQGYPPTG